VVRELAHQALVDFKEVEGKLSQPLEPTIAAADIVEGKAYP
jgi:hypothetical protein